MKTPKLLIAGVSAAVALASQASAQSYEFAVVPDTSRLTCRTLAESATEGALVGNYNATSNPGGTRTKPGLLGPFPDGENVPVPVLGGSRWEGDLNAPITGGFKMSFDIVNKKVKLNGLNLVVTPAAPAAPRGTFKSKSLEFRTRKPTFAYPAVQLTLPMEGPALTKATLGLNGDPVFGTMARVSNDAFNFRVPYVAKVVGSYKLRGVVRNFTCLVPMVLEGGVNFSGTNATVRMGAGTGTNAFQLGDPFALPVIPLELPAGPTDKAKVLLNLVVKRATLKFDKALAVNANGHRL